jgi:hypothetical protein
MFDFFVLGQPAEHHHNFQLAIEEAEQDPQV